MLPKAEGRVWPRAAPWAVLQLQFLFSSAIFLPRVKHRPRGGWDVPNGALPWPELLLCAPWAAGAPGSQPGEMQREVVKGHQSKPPRFGPWHVTECWGRAWLPTIHSEFVPLGPRLADGLCEGGVMEAGWRDETLQAWMFSALISLSPSFWSGPSASQEGISPRSLCPAPRTRNPGRTPHPQALPRLWGWPQPHLL